jgi:rare lipoprotein A
MKKALFLFSIIIFSSLLSAAQTERGKASYYADKFNGRKTANGEIFSNKEFTAAHRSLPFNTKVKVTNLDNGKTTIVRINDRGPFVKGRIIDVSRAAAIELNMLVAGVARVEIEVIKQETDPPLAKTKTTSIELFEVDVKLTTVEGYGIQVYSFQHVDNLFNEILRIEEEYNKKAFVHVSLVDGIRVYRLLLGPYDSEKKAKRKLKKIHKKGKEGFVVSFDQLR